MIEGEWWVWALTLVVVAFIAPVLSLVLDTWWAKRKKTQKVLTEEAFKKLFNESILPDPERNIRGMIEDLIRANVQARYLRRQHDATRGDLL